MGSEGQLWLSKSCGANATDITSDFIFMKVKFHPASETSILGLAKSDCSKGSSSKDGEDKQCATKTKLVLSQDAGKTYKVLRTHVLHFDWLKHHSQTIVPGADAIISTEYDLKFSPQTAKPSQKPQGVSLYFSWDFFETQTRIVDGGYRYWLSSRTLFVETADRKGRISLHATETHQNAFNWRPVILHGRLPNSEYKELIPITDLHGVQVNEYSKFSP